MAHKRKSHGDWVAWQNRLTKKKAKLFRKRTRNSDYRWQDQMDVNYAFGLPHGEYKRKPEHKSRALDIETFATFGTCPARRELQTHKAHPVIDGMCPGYLRVREDSEYDN